MKHSVTSKLQSTGALTLAASTALLIASTASFAVTHEHHLHSGSAPIGVMGDHLMDEGQYMLSYRYMAMDMEGNRTGTDRVATPLPGYMVSPLSMDMEMHMLGGMYGYNDDVTIMAMVPYISNRMDMLMNMSGMTFSRESSGIGDVKVSASYRFGDGDTLLNAGVSLPTGSIDERALAPMPSAGTIQMPYPMQLGSGTFDLMLGATHIFNGSDLTWGLQGLATIRTGENDNDYTLGNVVDLNAWLSKAFDKTYSGTFRINAKNWGNIDGADPLINAMMAPTGDPNLRGGTRVDANIGLNVTLGNNTFGIEVGVPVHQDLDGPQLETDSVITVGWQGTY